MVRCLARGSSGVDAALISARLAAFFSQGKGVLPDADFGLMILSVDTWLRPLTSCALLRVCFVSQGKLLLLLMPDNAGAEAGAAAAEAGAGAGVVPERASFILRASSARIAAAAAAETATEFSSTAVCTAAAAATDVSVAAGAVVGTEEEGSIAEDTAAATGGDITV